MIPSLSVADLELVKVKSDGRGLEGESGVDSFFIRTKRLIHQNFNPRICTQMAHAVSQMFYVLTSWRHHYMNYKVLHTYIYFATHFL